MKTVQVFIWIALAFVAGLGWGLWLEDKLAKPEPAQTTTAVKTSSSSPVANWPNVPGRPPMMPGMPSQGLWQEYQTARQQVLRDNPELAAEYKDLQGEIDAQRQKLNASMVKVEPQVVPIIAKLEALRQHSLDSSGTSQPTQPSPSGAPSK